MLEEKLTCLNEEILDLELHCKNKKEKFNKLKSIQNLQNAIINLENSTLANLNQHKLGSGLYSNDALSIGLGNGYEVKKEFIDHVLSFLQKEENRIEV